MGPQAEAEAVTGFGVDQFGLSPPFFFKLKHHLDAGEDIYVLDVREPHK